MRGVPLNTAEYTCAKCGKTVVRLPGRQVGKYCSQECYQATRNSHVSQCQECGKTYRHKSHHKGMYCSKACLRVAEARKHRTSTCPECGREFTWLAVEERKYCSNECRGKNTIGNIKHFAPSAYTATCEICGKEYQTTPKATRGRFCSQPCHGKWLSMYRRGIMNHRTGRKFGRSPHLPPPVYKDCIVCGTPFLTKRSHLDRRQCCSKRCYGAVLASRISGENNHNWRGGYQPYYGPTWRNARTATRKRDLVCQDCGISPQELGRELDVHHIRRFNDYGVERHIEANRLSNLVALCPSCHLRREWATYNRKG